MIPKKIFFFSVVVAVSTPGAIFAKTSGKCPSQKSNPDVVVSPHGAVPCWPHQGEIDRPEDMKFNLTLKKNYLEKVLTLTDSQKILFNKYVKSVEAYYRVETSFSTILDGSKDNLNHRLAIQNARDSALQKAHETRQEFVKVLTPEQVRILDSVELHAHTRPTVLDPKLINISVLLSGSTAYAEANV